MEFKNRNFNSIPYGEAVSLLTKKSSVDNYSSILSLLSNRSGKLPLELVNDFVTEIRAKYEKHFSNYSFTGIKEVANDLGWEVIGMPSPNPVYQKNRSYFGCQYYGLDKRRIVISEQISIVQAKATVAHEILHYLFTIDGIRPGRIPPDPIEEFLCEYGAAKMLIEDAQIDDCLMADTNKAASLNGLSKMLKVPRKFVAYRMLDPLNHLRSDVLAIIEWSQDGENGEFSPVWSVSRKSFIPSVNKKCKAKKGSVIFNSLMTRGFDEQSAIEEVSIGTLRGSLRVCVCSFGSSDQKNRTAVSTFSLVK